MRIFENQRLPISILLFEIIRINLKEKEKIKFNGGNQNWNEKMISQI
jgi:hypothetical protein